VTAPRPFLGVLLVTALAAPTASAQPCFRPIPQAPDACGPGFYSTNGCGMVYGPGYCLRPCFPPFQGMILGPPPKPVGAGPAAGGPQCGPQCGPQGGPCAGAYGPPGLWGPYACPCSIPGPPPTPLFPTHPYARSPRDYFMYYDKDRLDQRPY
jgi:hypothetical protein